MMTEGIANSGVGARRTRRSIVKMGAILASVGLARASRASAGLPSPISPVPVAPSPQCFLKGTKIQTALGERNIEDLAIGDMLPTVFGGIRPIQWIGRYPFKRSDPSKPWPRDVRPVRVAQSSLAPGVPRAELYLTAEHALLIDDLLIPVGNLINGTTITRLEAREFDQLEYFNIKVEGHDVIHAEGAPVETLRNVDESAVNFAEYLRIYGSPTTEETRCAPWVSYGGGRGELKSRFRSAISPWLDRRQPIDVIRDRLEERGINLSRLSEPMLA